MTAERAIEIARGVAEAREWDWLGPVRAEITAEGWEVRSNADALGTNVVVLVDASGSVKRAAFLAR